MIFSCSTMVKTKTSMVQLTMLCFIYSRWCEGLRIMPGLRKMRCIMDKIKFFTLYMEASEEVKTQVQNLLEETQSQPECEAEPVDTSDTEEGLWWLL